MFSMSTTIGSKPTEIAGDIAANASAENKRRERVVQSAGKGTAKRRDEEATQSKHRKKKEKRNSEQKKTTHHPCLIDAGRLHDAEELLDVDHAIVVPGDTKKHTKMQK